MKKFITLFIIFVSVAMYAKVTKTISDTDQSPLAGPECLGIYKYITVSEANRRSDGCYVVTIETPPEGLDFYYSPRGPGMPRYENFLGNTVDLVFNRDLMDDLLGFTDDNPATIDIMVKKWYYQGIYHSTEIIGSTQCWYYIVVHTSPPYIGR